MHGFMVVVPGWVILLASGCVGGGPLMGVATKAGGESTAEDSTSTSTGTTTPIGAHVVGRAWRAEFLIRDGVGDGGRFGYSWFNVDALPTYDILCTQLVDWNTLGQAACTNCDYAFTMLTGSSARVEGDHCDLFSIEDFDMGNLESTWLITATKGTDYRISYMGSGPEAFLSTAAYNTDERRMIYWSGETLVGQVSLAGRYSPYYYRYF